MFWLWIIVVCYSGDVLFVKIAVFVYDCVAHVLLFDFIFSFWNSTILCQGIHILCFSSASKIFICILNHTFFIDTFKSIIIKTIIFQ